jgi:hypothetical protein
MAQQRSVRDQEPEQFRQYLIVLARTQMGRHAAAGEAVSGRARI